MRTWQMIKELTENPKLRFKNGLMSVVEIGDKTKAIVWKSEDNEEAPFIIYSHSGSGVDNLHIEWELVPEPVDFMTAVNSGKRIKHEEWELYRELGDVLDILGGASDTNIADKINGKWFIEC